MKESEKRNSLIQKVKKGGREKGMKIISKNRKPQSKKQ